MLAHCAFKAVTGAPRHTVFLLVRRESLSPAATMSLRSLMSPWRQQGDPSCRDFPEMSRIVLAISRLRQHGCLKSANLPEARAPR